ncbi:MAG: glycosyltransferase [Muribaculaceae bacterium]|nr:glycosyltransferase [Muribaculaceae bacterium]
MNILLVNRSDLLGGAAIATSRLMDGLNALGAQARMLVIDRRGTLPGVEVAGGKWGNRYRFLAERLGIYLRNGMNRSTLFQIDTATHGVDIARHPWTDWADVIVLGWVNQAMLSLNDVKRLAALGKPIVWVMHDMWNCTGVCHHAAQCRAYEDSCRSCPLTGKQGEDISTSTQRRKRMLYESAHIHFVAVSHWLEQCCRRSSVMRDCDISVIANPFPSTSFSPVADLSNPWNVETGRSVMVMGAARLDDPVKGLDTLIATTQHIATCRPELARRLHLVLYGGIRDASLLEQLALPYTYLGYVHNLPDIYSHAQLVLSTSRYESFGYTLVEGMACGCIPVTTGDGGQVDIVKHRENGFVTGSHDPVHIAQGIEWALDASITRESQHQWVHDHFDSSVIARQHLALYQSLLNKNDNFKQ